jgi:hypothetical protein
MLVGELETPIIMVSISKNQLELGLIFEIGITTRIEFLILKKKTKFDNVLNMEVEKS